MRTTIWEYLIPSPEKKEELWNRCTFVFDTNVLLNLYRYTANTRDTLLAALDDLKDRVWLPHQVAYEYAKNRFDVIYETIEKYKKLEQLEQEFIKQYITELRLKPTDASVGELQKLIETWISKQKKKNVLVTQASDDKILEKVLSIFDNKVGCPFTKEDLDAIQAEGKDRFDKQIPPGFCDAKKEKDGIENNAYGDLIVWKQILSFSSHEHKDIIYITHDQKKDWWLMAKGRTVGPRIELRKEFAENTGQEFYMYSMESFLEQYSKHKGKAADQSVLDEVTHIERDSKQKIRKKIISLSQYSMSLERNVFDLHRRIARRQHAIANIQAKYRDKPMPPDVITQLNNTQTKMMQLQHELAIKQEELESCRQQIAENNVMITY